ncbi:MAG: hypothetical protein GXY15_04560, partial [Candidatus Hydrogenedentes bacterium]|nr:hypothetical protein [Candidatus Hydrogenedentota bacterium]
MRGTVRLGVLVGVAVLALGGVGFFAGWAGLPGASAQSPSPSPSPAPAVSQAAAVRAWYERTLQASPPPAHTPMEVCETSLSTDIPAALLDPEAVTELLPEAKSLKGLENRLETLRDRRSPTAAKMQSGGASRAPKDLKTLDQFFVSLNLASDFAYTWEYFDSTAAPGTIDCNALLTTTAGQITPLAPNGIPDQTEFLLLQEILQTEGYDRSAQGGASQAAAAARWYTIEDAFALVEGVSSVDQRIRNTITAYCMLGDLVSVYVGLLMGSAVGWLPETETAQNDLLHYPPWPFSFVGDTDGDGLSNLLEWQDAPSTYLVRAADPLQCPTGTFRTMTRTMEGGALWPYPVAEKYASGSDAMLRAIACPPWEFKRWEITPSGGSMQTSTANPLFVTMDTDVAVHAVYGPDEDADIAPYIDDPALEQAIRVAVGSFGGPLYWSEVLDGKLTSLTASGLGISHLDGLELLVELVTLDLYDNEIADIEEVSMLTSLEELDLGRNSITDLSPLAPLVNLTAVELGCGNILTRGIAPIPGQSNQIVDVSPLADLTQLTFLGLSGNDITDVSPLADLENLQYLALSGNPATDFSPLYGLQDLVLLGLGDLGLNDTQMTSLLSNWPDLMGVDVSWNNLTSLSCVSSCTGLQLILAHGNFSLASIAALSNTPDLQVLLAASCQITSADALAGVAESENTFYLQDNQISGLSALAAATFTDSYVDLTGNPLTQDDVCTHIPVLEARDNQVDHDAFCGPSYSLGTAVSPADSGAVSPFTGTRAVAQNSTVQLEAVQTNPAYVFQSWQGDASGTDPQTAVEMTANKNVTAVFAASAITLTMLPHEGVGTVSPAPGEWACRSGEYRCLSAAPGPGWAFLHWVDSANAVVSDDPNHCFEVSASTSFRAVFLPAEVTLDMYRVGEGSVQPPEGRHYFLYNDDVSLQAWPFSGWFFDQWSGDAAGGEPLSSIVMNQNREITANFAAYDGSLTVQVTGQGSVSPTPGVHCHLDGDVVPFEVDPAPGWMLDHWEGALASEGRYRKPSLVTQGTQTVTVVFVQVPQTAVTFADANLEAAVRGAIDKPAGDLYLTDLVGRDPEFTELDAYSSQIASLQGLEHCADLTFLNLSGNPGITSLAPVAPLVNLQILILSGTQPVSLEPIGDLHHLFGLVLDGCGVSDWSFLAPLTELWVLSVGDNGVSDLSFLANRTGLWGLSIADNDVTDPSILSTLTNLEHLEVSSNPLATAGLGFAAPLVNLTYFQADDIGVSDLTPLAGLGNLEMLYLEDNDITDLAPLVANTGLASGDDVRLSMNPLTQEALCTQIPALQARGVYVLHDGSCRHVLDVDVVGEGSVALSPDQTDYAPDTEVSLTATADDHWHFVEWQGDATGGTSPATVTLDTNRAVTAVFAVDRHTVTVTAPGGGLVTLSSGEESDGPAAEVSLELDYGASYTVTATAEDHWHFLEWQDDLTGAQTPAQGTVSGDLEITAAFEKDTHTVSLSTLQTTGGTITLAAGANSDGPDTEVSLEVDYGTEVTLTAAPASLWQFSEWTGDVTGSGNPVAVTVGEDMDAEAVFTQTQHTITVSAVSAHAGLSLPVECAITLTLTANNLYDGPAASVSLPNVSYDAAFTVEADVAEGWRLKEWQGGGVFTGNALLLQGTFAGDLTGTAVFAKEQTLSVELAPDSLVKVDVYGPDLMAPDASTVLDATEQRVLYEYVVDYGTELTLYPYPLNEAPWRFTGWLGDDASLVVDGVVEMTDDIALVAGFTPEWALVLEDPGIAAVPEPYYTGRYLDGVEVVLTAVPPEGYHLSGWTGHLSGAVNPETLEMDGNKAVGAVYAKDGHTLTVACDG